MEEEKRRVGTKKKSSRCETFSQKTRPSSEAVSGEVETVGTDAGLDRRAGKQSGPGKQGELTSGAKDLSREGGNHQMASIGVKGSPVNTNFRKDGRRALRRNRHPTENEARQGDSNRPRSLPDLHYGKEKEKTGQSNSSIGLEGRGGGANTEKKRVQIHSGLSSLKAKLADDDLWKKIAQWTERDE